MTSGADRTIDPRWRAWRPMPFGPKPARTVRDPVIEPLWPGRRVLVHVAAGRRERPAIDMPAIDIVDEDGLELQGHPDIRAALLAAVLAEDVVLDGYLLDLPRRSATGMFGGEPAVELPGLSGTARQLVLGGRGMGREAGSRLPRLAATVGPAPGVSASDDGPAGSGSVAGLVAVDLLAIDADVLLDVPLLERKRLLDSALLAGEQVRRGPHVRPPGESWYGQWRAFGFRQIAVKSANSRYRPGVPSDDWAVAPLPRG